MRTLLAHARPHLPVLLGALLLALVGSAAGLAQPLAARFVIDTLGERGSLFAPVLVLTGLVAGSAIANGANAYLIGRTGEDVVLGVRRRLAGRLVRLKVSELDFRSPGDLVSRATSDTNWVRQAATSAPVQIVNGAVGLMGGLALMAMLDSRLFAVTIAVLLVIAMMTCSVMPRIRVATHEAQESVGLVGSALDRALGAARTVKAAGAEQYEQGRIDSASERAYRAGLTGARWNSVLAVVGELSVQSSFLVVLGIGGAFVAAGSLSVSTLVAFLLYLFYITSPISRLLTAISALQQGLGALRRLSDVDGMVIEPDVDNHCPVTRPEAAAPALHLDRVCFAYPGRDNVLHDVTFRVPAGSRVALVGPSGCGKSTLLALLLRFHDPCSGTISLEGVALATRRRSEIRRRIGYVEQETPALEGTLRENLVYAAPHATEQELWRAVADTRLDELVARLPDGLESSVGPRGVTLSGGERQRLAIARALLRRPDMLLLDEATAHLDARTEEAMSGLLSGRSIGCTVLVIAHRMATVRDADSILILDGGRVRAQGTHEELFASDELYRELATTQLTGPIRAET